MHRHTTRRWRALPLALATSLLANVAVGVAEAAPTAEPAPISFVDFEDGDLVGWTIESEHFGALETSWDVEPGVGVDGSGGLRLTYTDLQGEEHEGYADEARTALTSPWFDSPGLPVFVSFATWHDIEGLEYDEIHVEWQSGSDGEWTLVGDDPSTERVEDGAMVLGGGAGDTNAFRRLAAPFLPTAGEFRVRLRFFSDIANSTVTPITAPWEGAWIDDLRLGTSLPADIDPREKTWPATHGRDREGRGVVALNQTAWSVDPYHAEFRDRSKSAYVHPSTYLDGYPADAQPLWLTLDADTYQQAIDADADVWSSIEPNTLYWVPGTRIVALYAMQTILDDNDTPTEPEVNHSCLAGCLGPGQNAQWAASRAVGATTGSCPDCLLAMFTGKSARGHDEVLAHDWIDAVGQVLTSSEVSDSTVNPEAHYPGMGEAAERLATSRPLFTVGPSTGNNGLAFVAAPGAPVVLTTSPANVPGTINVGGHDSGHVTHWNGYPTQLVADVCRTRVAQVRTLDGIAEEGVLPHFTAVPWIAGQAARIAQEARELLGDTSSGTADGIVTEGAAPTAITTGPLADGVLTAEELEDLLFASATPRPIAEPGDGPRCEVGDDGYHGHYGANASPELAWADVPEDVPAYVNVGYGGLDSTSYARAVAVLRGEAEAADRSEVDAWFAADEVTRQTFQDSIGFFEDAFLQITGGGL